MSLVSYLSSVARATAALISLVILVVAMAASPFPSQAEDRKPVAVKDKARATAGQWTSINVLSNDYDPDGTKVRLKGAKKPKLGKVRIKKNKKLKYRPRNSARGRDVIRYVIRDRNGTGQRATGKVVVNVGNPGAPFAELCTDPSVLRCVGFDVDLTEAAFNNSAGYTHPVAIDNTKFYEGGGAQKHTIDGANGMDMSGTVGYAFPSVSTGSVFLSWRMRTGNGLWDLLRRSGFGTASGLKFVQVVAGERSCSAEEITLADNFLYSYSTGFLGLSQSCSGFPFREGSDWQPVLGNLDDCGFWHIVNQRNAGQPTQSPPCVLLEDNTWHLLTLEIAINQGVRLWIDNQLTMDIDRTEQGTIPQGPYGRIYFDNYATGYSANETPGLWPVWYDNLIISTECVTGCGS